MNSLLDWFTNYCINNKLISRDNEAWFRYGLEKRICTLIVLVPFAIVAINISEFWTALFYMISFYYLRSQTNGYHAKTHWGCFIGSLLLLLFFVFFIEPMLDAFWILVLVSITVMIVGWYLYFSNVDVNRITSAMNVGAGLTTIIAALLARVGLANGAFIAGVISGGLWAVASLIQYVNARGRGIRVRITLLPIPPFAFVTSIKSR